LIAFVWAVEPSASSFPVEQVGPLAAGVLEPPAEAVPAGVVVSAFFFELEQADSTTAQAMSPAMAPARYSFTLSSPRHWLFQTRR
jgi:hypothetical protein